MNEDDNRDDLEEKSAYLAVQLSGYAKASLVMIFVVYLGWALAGGIDAHFVTMSDPQLNQEIAQLSEDILDGKSTQNWQDVFSQTMLSVAPRMHWLADAFISGVLTCAFVGWLVGKWTDNPRWAGLMPVLYILSGLNPACLGDGVYVQRLTLEEQFLVVAGQCISAHLFAYRVYEKKSKK
ncbi:MAG: hypothetical protein Q4F00_07010 [bacterium]|nr:hypothetical protein [bacterium]